MAATKEDTIELSAYEQELLLMLVNCGDTMAERMSREPLAYILAEEWKRILNQLRPVIGKARLKSA